MVNLNLGVKSNSNLLNNLVSGTSYEKAIPIAIDDLIPYHNQPFHLYSTDKLLDLAESIEAQGLLHFPIVRPLNNQQYQILSGHNRIEACKLLDLKTIPCVIKEHLTDEDAELIMLNANLKQRQLLSHKEKIYAYSRQHQLQKQAKKVNVAEFSEDVRTIQRYVKLASLTDEFIDMIDKNKLQLGTAYELAFLSKDNQEILMTYILNHNHKVTIKQAKQLRQFEVLSDDILDSIFYQTDKKDTLAKVHQTMLKIADKELPIAIELNDLHLLIEYLVSAKIIK